MDDDEDQTLQEAIQESLNEQSSTSARQFGDPSYQETSEASQTLPRRVNIEDRIKEITLQPAPEIPLISDPKGDTWVFIDPPSKQPEQDNVDYDRYSKRYETPMLVKKETLLRYHSPDPNEGFNLEALFGPSAQYRTIRRRKLTAKIRDDPQIKYVIDLTPPAEGDDAVFLTTELCCSQGVRLWHQAGVIWGISNMLVGGKEEYSSVERRSFLSRTASADEGEDGTNTGRSSAYNNQNPSLTFPSTIMPPEYTPLRHRSAIERVIAALVGVDPKLNSAPKLWTTFAVANYFGLLKSSPITDYIVRWLRAYPNSFFLEVCPEVSIRIANGLENHDLTRDTFAILVGEEALDSLVYARKHNSNSQHTVYGRRKEDLPEKIFSRIQYASKSLQERSRIDFEDFAGKEMQWVEQLPEVQKLLSCQQPKLLGKVNTLISLLKNYVRGTIHKLLCVDYGYVPPPDFHHLGGEELLRRVSRAKIWTELTVNERILTRTFWLVLRFSKLFEGSTNFHIKNSWGMDWDDAKLGLEYNHSVDLGEVRNQELNRLIHEGNDLFEQENLPMFKLPDRTGSQSGVDPAHPNDVTSVTRRPVENLFGTQNASLEQIVCDLKPSNPIDNPHQTFRLQAQVSKLDNKPIRSSLPTSQDADPRGSTEEPRNPRPDWWDDKAMDDEGHGGFLGCKPLLAHDPGVVQDQSQWPAPQGFLSWSDLEEVGIANAGESQPPDQEDEDGRSTPPFFRDPQESPDPLGQKLSPKTKNREQRPNAWTPARTAFFDLNEFFTQAKAFVNIAANRKLQFADHESRDEPYEIGITNTLVCLEDSEWKYLPLWAGGYDDDSGGVFNDQLPIDDLGFSTCGPEVHTGITPAHSVNAGSEFEMVDSEFGAATANTSMVNNRSSGGALNRKRVYAADSIESSSADDFDMVTPEESSVEEDARKQVDAQERLEAAENDAARERVKNGEAIAVDENYADLFNAYEDDEDTDRADDGDSLMDDDSEDYDTDMV